MAKGLPKSIIKKYGISKKAWAVFRGKKRSRGSNPKTRTKKTKRRYFSLGKKKRRRREMTLPIAPIIGILAAPASQSIINDALAGNIQAIPKHAAGFIGIWGDGSFHIDTLMANITPMVVGALVHKFVGGKPLNLNRTLASAGVPFVRI